MTNNSAKKTTANEIKTTKVPQQCIKTHSPSTSYQNSVGSTHISTQPLPPQTSKPSSGNESKVGQNGK